MVDEESGEQALPPGRHTQGAEVGGGFGGLAGDSFTSGPSGRADRGGGEEPPILDSLFWLADRAFALLAFCCGFRLFSTLRPIYGS